MGQKGEERKEEDKLGKFADRFGKDGKGSRRVFRKGKWKWRKRAATKVGRAGERQLARGTVEEMRGKGKGNDGEGIRMMMRRAACVVVLSRVVSRDSRLRRGPDGRGVRRSRSVGASRSALGWLAAWPGGRLRPAGAVEEHGRAQWQAELVGRCARRCRAPRGARKADAAGGPNRVQGRRRRREETGGRRATEMQSCMNG